MPFDKTTEEGMEVTGTTQKLLGHAEIDLIPSMAAMNLMESQPVLITAETFWAMGSSMTNLIREGRLYTFQQFEMESRRYGTITFDPLGYVYLHHLRNTPPPSRTGVCFIEHGELMRSVAASSRKVFLDLSINGTRIGKMHIRLTSSRAAQQFFVLCSGELGPSYANTKFLEVWERGFEKEYVIGGDYEFNDGSGGKAITEGLGDGEDYNRPWLAGTVFGFLLWRKVAGQFCILTKDNPSMVLSTPSFGMVEKGLDILTQVLELRHNIRDLSVIDCGVVLHPSSQ